MDDHPPNGGPRAGRSPATDAGGDRDRLTQFETIMAVHPDPVFATDAEGDLTFVNDAFEALLGYSLDGREDPLHFSTFLDADDGARVRTVLGELVADGESAPDRRTLEVEGVTADGRTVALECSVGLLPDDGGFAGAAGVLRDVTDERRRSEVFNVMNRALRHNLRHKVDIITGRTELLREELDDATLDTQLVSIADNTRWLGKLGITLRTLQLAIDESLERDEPVPVKEVVAGAVANVRRDHPDGDIDMHVSARGSLEAGRPIELALQNLIENGIVHASPEVPRAEPAAGGTVEGGAGNDDADVETDGLADDDTRGASGDESDDDAEDTGEGKGPHVDVWVAHGPRDGWLDIHVEDEGPGIPELEREIVLGEADITQLQHASGIGLWITRWVVEVFDGQVEIAENEPRGTVVTLRLPLAEDGN